jgi:hypothetical protein
MRLVTIAVVELIRELIRKTETVVGFIVAGRWAHHF